MSIHQVSFENLGGYDKAIEKLNAVVLEPGFVWRAYSPASLKFYGVERKYFSEENAIKIDSVYGGRLKNGEMLLQLVILKRDFLSQIF
ncbi:hypothetical protein LN650_28750 [Klebsiella pneumoniae subsp. pneumoniae]|nr:hypothetical protein [Klebsiella pneumoniae subsp. pneumoniae]